MIRPRPEPWVLLPLLLASAACTAHPGETPGSDEMIADDGGAAFAPPAPRLDPLPSSVPHHLAPIRGVAPNARRVIVESGGESIADSVLPDGTFCLEVELADGDPHTFVIWSQGDDGSFSESPATATLTYDPRAPRTAGAALCGGNDPDECTGAEICGNGVDDDCNGLVDASDSACGDCRPDALEPNDGPDSPFISLGETYENLEICPGERDYHPFFAYRADHIILTISFTHADGDLDMRLHDIDNDQVIDTSAGVDDGEAIDFEVTRTGHYALEVYGFGDASNTYSFTAIEP